MSRYIMLLLLSLVWSSAFLFTKYLDRFVSPLMVLEARAIIGALCLLVICGVLGKSLRVNRFSSRQHALLCLSGILVGYLWFSIAQSELDLPAGVASLMPASTAVFSWLLSVIFRFKRFYWGHALGILVAACGVVEAIGWSHIASHHASLIAVLILLSGFFALAINAMMVNRFFVGHDALIVTTYSISYAACICVAMFVFNSGVSFSGLSGSVWGCLLGAGIISTASGYMLYFWLIQRAGPVFTSLFGYLVPVFGVFFSSMIFNEVLTAHFFLGGGAILLGIALIRERKMRITTA